MSGQNPGGRIPPSRRAHPRTIGQRFGDLKVRPKLMVLHNLFFLVLTVAVYFSLIPLVEGRLAEARRREVSLILEGFGKVGPLGPSKGLAMYDLETGTAAELGMPAAAREWTGAHPEEIWWREQESDYIYKRDPLSDRYWRLRLPIEFYSGIVESAKIVVFSVLGAAYVFAVLLLELVIIPRYVYTPLRVVLMADEATRRGDRASEIIDAGDIPGDEIGQIMASRNATVLELRRREDDLEQTNQRLEAAKRSLEAHDRLVSLGQLSASIAHEMNTPLAVLHGSIEKLLETTGEPAVRARLERMIRVTQRLRRISESMLDFARLRKREMEPLDLHALVDEAWGLLAIDEKAAEVVFSNRIAPGTRVSGNSDQLIQVFLNLLRNALNAVPAAGEIRVERRPAFLNGRPAHSIVVEDNGPGIPPEVLPEIFDAFVSTRLDSRGTGLGLTVAEGIISQHGGTISATNRKEGGACLEVRLPAAHESAAILENRP